MAKTNDDPAIAKLTEESRKHIEEMKTELEAADKDIEALEGLGFDMSRLKERVSWAKKARETILKRLT